jgi:hypothetical protein
MPFGSNSNAEGRNSTGYYVSMDTTPSKILGCIPLVWFILVGRLSTLFWIVFLSLPQLIFACVIGLLYIKDCWKLSIWTFTFGLTTFLEPLAFIIVYYFPTKVTLFISRITSVVSGCFKLILIVFGVVWNAIPYTKDGDKCTILEYSNWALLGCGVLTMVLILVFILTLREPFFFPPKTLNPAKPEDYDDEL